MLEDIDRQLPPHLVQGYDPPRKHFGQNLTKADGGRKICIGSYFYLHFSIKTSIYIEDIHGYWDIDSY